MIKSQPLIAVENVRRASRWYQQVLGFESGHGGDEYERLLSDGELVLQLHQWDAHDHPNLGSELNTSRGNGALLWFCVEDFDAVVNRLGVVDVQVLEEPAINTQANHREIWFRDLDGYTVVVASAYGDV